MRHWPLYIAEFVTSFLLVLIGAGAVCWKLASGSGLGGAIAVTVIAGLAAMGMMYAFLQISNRHNRSTELLASARFPFGQLVAYVSCQLAGAWLAGTILRLAVPAVAWSGIKLAGGPWVWVFLVEIAVVTGFMVAIMGIVTDNQAVVQAEAMAVSGVLAAIAVTSGPKDGGWLNPARPLGPALANEIIHLLWLYVLGPVLGAIAGALIYRAVQTVKNRPAQLPRPAKPPKPKIPPPPPEPPKPKEPPRLAAPVALVAATPARDVKLTWQAVAEADHYVITRDGTEVGTATQPAWQDTNVSDGSYQYAVSAVRAGGQAGEASAAVGVVVDRSGPHIAPFGPFAKDERAPFRLEIAATDELSGLAGGEYFIGITDPGPGSGTALELMPGGLRTAATDSTLADLPAGSYILNVRAVDTLENWTEPAVTSQLTVASITPPPHAGGPLAAPVDVAATESPTRRAAKLSWSAVTDATTYQIWKRNIKTLANVQAGTSTTPEFTDQYEPGNFHYYIIATAEGREPSTPSVPVLVKVLSNSSLEVQEFMEITNPGVIPHIDRKN